MQADMTSLLPEDFERELSAIADWWLTHAVDHARGGVHGEVADDNTVAANADRSAILQTRALWFFSEASVLSGDQKAREAADALYGYVLQSLFDRKHGGIYWSITADGAPAATRKQTYAQAFAVYAISAYAKAAGGEEAADQAVELARLMEERAWDEVHGGYVEAFAQDWSPIEDVRLSERDLNAPKTMNTHLHVLEAYTGLHQAAKSDFTRRILKKNIELFDKRFAAPHGGKHLALFYTADWREHDAGESYGHDIEASWLLYEAAEALGDDALLGRTRQRALSLAEAALGAVDEQGGFIYERHADGAIDRKRHWWPQAEAMVGFYNAFQLSGDRRFYDAAAQIWAFIDTHQIDRKNGEWFWYAAADRGARNPYKVGFWKGPYHNGRAMMEMIRRLRRA